MYRFIRTLAFLAAVCTLVAAGAEAGTMDDVKKKGFVRCGVSQGVPGFSNPDAQGNWTGIDVDICRGVAVALFNDPTKVKYLPLSAKERFTALQSGEVDVLSRNTTWTLVRDTALGLNFTGVTYYDGQGFMVTKKLNVKSAKQLNGASVCVSIGTTTELNLADYFRANNMSYKPVTFEKADEVIAAYDAGRCDVFTTDRSGLAAQRLKLKNPDGHVVLPEIISKEPLGPVVRHGDDQWFDLVKWVLYAMLEAEEYGVNSENVDQMKATSKDPVVKRILGVEGDMGKNLGVDNAWAHNIIKKIGNYGEIYERNVGPRTPLKLERGMNALWNKGGLQYPMPIR
ncbi:MAG: amino acid ABC transporter substrate-binding protein [Candidatus Rokubacteria bacterium]|nr:amino acid ABC transporter substrate-binding protein [Candidatus Rokubacteria bacterium]